MYAKKAPKAGAQAAIQASAAVQLSACSTKPQAWSHGGTKISSSFAFQARREPRSERVDSRNSGKRVILDLP